MPPIAVTWPAFASSAPSVFPAIGKERNCVTYTVSCVSSATPLLVMVGLLAGPVIEIPVPALKARLAAAGVEIRPSSEAA